MHYSCVKVGRAGLVQTQLHTDHNHTDPDRAGGAVAAVGPRGGQVRAERERLRRRVHVHGPLQRVLGGDDTVGHELQR